MAFVVFVMFIVGVVMGRRALGITCHDSRIMRIGEPLLAVKRVEHQPERIEAAHQHARGRQHIGEPRARQRRRMQGLDNGVLGEKPRERRQTRVGQRADQHGDVGNRQIFPQTAHLAHVLLVVHRDNH